MYEKQLFILDTRCWCVVTGNTTLRYRAEKELPLVRGYVYVTFSPSEIIFPIVLGVVVL